MSDPSVSSLPTPSRLFQSGTLTFADLSTGDPALGTALERARLAAPHDLETLIFGETGTGKNLVALAMHNASPRRDKPFVQLNAAAIAEPLVESELFGHQRGAFTGALADRQGVFELAHGGTLFLDEVGNMSPAVQQKLLTAVEQKTFYRVGGRTRLAVDLRIISATNADLRRDLESGAFRQDLYFRLARIVISLPPLRQRGNDILPLAARFLEDSNARFGRQAEGFSDSCKAMILSYSWPGNVRELRSRIACAVAMSPRPVITETDVFFDGVVGPGFSTTLSGGGRDLTLEEESLTLEAVERRHIERVFRLHGGNVTHAAKVLGLSRFGLHKILRRLGIAEAMAPSQPPQPGQGKT